MAANTNSGFGTTYPYPPTRLPITGATQVPPILTASTEVPPDAGRFMDLSLDRTLEVCLQFHDATRCCVRRRLGVYQRLRFVELENQALSAKCKSLQTLVEQLQRELQEAKKPKGKGKGKSSNVVLVTEDERIKWAGESSIVFVDPWVDPNILNQAAPSEEVDFLRKDRYDLEPPKIVLCQLAEVRAHIAERNLLAALDDPARHDGFVKKVHAHYDCSCLRC